MDKSPKFHPIDDHARETLSDLRSLDFAAIGVLDPDGAPEVSRIGHLWHDGAPHALISELSDHTQRLLADPRASLLLGDPGPKGDPLTHPRLTLQVRATWADKVALRGAYVAARPKVKLYYDFADFRVARFEVLSGTLVAGFGRAYRVAPTDL